MKQIAIGSDHAGFELKSVLINHLESIGYEVEDFGTLSSDSVDYPDYAHAVSNSIESGKHTQGVLICGSANGISMAANKHQGIRCAICWTPEIASLAKLHNDANIIAFPARFINDETAIESLNVFLETSFEGGRHSKRVDKIGC